MGRKKMTQERQRQIFIGLFNAICEKGFAGSTITDISREAGLSRGILHYYFKNKREMQLELMRSLGKTHFDGIRWLISGLEDALEKIKGMIQFHYMDETKPFHDMVRVWVEFWGQAPHDQDVREVIQENQRRLRDLIASLLREGMEQGAFRTVDPVSTASMILGLIEGLTLQKCVDWKSIQMEEMSQTIGDFLQQYLARPSPAATS